MKKVPLFFSLAVALTASFFLSKVSEKNTLLLIAALGYHFVVAGYISLVAFHSDHQAHIIKPAKFNDYMLGVFLLLVLCISFGGYLGNSKDYITFFASIYGLLAGTLVGGIIAYKLAGKKITNWILFKFKSKFLF